MKGGVDNPIGTGPQAGKKLDRKEYDHALDIYYRRWGWDPDGIPPDLNPS